MDEQFKNIKEIIEKKAEVRDSALKIGSDIIVLSKKIIYDVHRGKIDNAEDNTKKIAEKLSELKSLINSEPELAFSSTFDTAHQEYCEAVCFLEFIKSGKIPSCKDLQISEKRYLLGLFDLAGELKRYAINSIIKGDYAKVMEIKAFLDELYGELIQFDFRDKILRKNFDRIKYVVEDLENKILELKLSGKV